MSNGVAVTGMGVVSPVGIGVPAMWSGIAAGESGISSVASIDVSDLPSRIAGQVLDFDGDTALGSRTTRRTDRYVQMTLVAAREALADSGLESDEALSPQFGCFLGSGIGGIGTLSTQYDVLAERGPRRVSPFLVPMMIVNMAAGQVAIDLGINGPNMAMVSACASGAHAIGEAAATIQRGDAVAMLAGGCEAPISRIGMAGFCQGRAMSTGFNDNPAAASRPFDAGRDGFVIAEGAGVLVLEDEQHARARDAHIHALLLGYGASADAFHITLPPDDGGGAAHAMRRALAKAELNGDGIDYINAHGTSTSSGDSAETIAIRSVFGDAADRLAVSSSKSMLGHMIGAAGAVESIISIKAIAEGAAPPTINYEEPDPACDLDYVPNETRAMPIRTALSNSFGFGGQNASLIFGAA
ncbi:MAG TPA: beta-ketoacyl-ACP synthase II [Chloroflexota bacterium]|nr:beta-ketoacyl-ACP synthase II [Chloroflexota bacterium]